jgi:nitrite reductase/ring-hydroxylating ferredoxin subunit
MPPRKTIEGDTAYSMPPSSYRSELTEVGRGTPMGELMRRYWHPVATIKDATSTPKQIRMLGEDLVLFRDRQGRPGLVHARCAHRGTTLYYGKVEERGIRCCYHGGCTMWKAGAWNNHANRISASEAAKGCASLGIR